MYYILNNIALRSFRYVPYAYYVRGDSYARGLKKEEFELLQKCDGRTDVEDSELLRQLISRGLVRKSASGEVLTEWQKHRACDNRYMPKMNLQITGRCNYNCLHCFNAKDNAPLQSELSLEQVCRLLDECGECGIQSFTITGGEPMIHPKYRQIIEEIYKRDMFVFELNTNGFFITQEMLDWMKSIDYYPLVKISFDGLGVHNWMRGYAKAEEKTLEAVKLCIDNGFKVMIQMNVNKKSKDVLVASCDMLDKMGVSEIRIINTTDVPRWAENGKEYTFTTEEYYEAAIEFFREFYATDRNADIDIWMVCKVFSKHNSYNLSPIVCGAGEYRDSLPLCKGTRGMIAVGSNGNVYPCHQTSGIFEARGIFLGNILEQPLKELLQESEYMRVVDTTVGEKRQASNKCHDCEHFEKCAGGCPGLANVFKGSYLKEDETKCIFFNKKYDERIRKVFNDLNYRSLN